jgi:hypothetical protein
MGPLLSGRPLQIHCLNFSSVLHELQISHEETAHLMEVRDKSVDGNRLRCIVSAARSKDCQSVERTVSGVEEVQVAQTEPLAPSDESPAPAGQK